MSVLPDGIRSRRRAASIAATVSALGTNGSKGNAFSAAKRIIIMRNASDTVNRRLLAACEAGIPIEAKFLECERSVDTG